MKHRNEIDGLRAIAVLPVIFHHAGFALFSGGFVGVDVFFVISGYLITRLILEELARGEFSIRRFYARRARRILPALFVMMFACIPFALLWMLPSQFLDFSQSLMAVMLFASNILFWRESGYFAAEAAEKPLLHTWSLGVEEQYYVLMPLALMLLWRFGRPRLFGGVVAAALVSFALCEYASRYYINVNFFLIPTRAWELLIGSLCAIIHTRSEVKKQDVLSALGLAMILVAVFVYDKHMRLPSAYTLLPVLGTALVLLYGSAGSWTARLLATRALVGIGLISYSAYLWHHPLFALARIRTHATPDVVTMLVLAAAALALGALSWRYVEQPFRQKAHPRYVSNHRALIMACGAAVTLMGIGIYGHITRGLFDLWVQHSPPSRVRAFTLMDTAQAKQVSHFYDNGDCVFRINALTPEVESRLGGCRKKYGQGVVIIGDSHAINLFFVLKKHAQHTPFILGLSQGMCRPHSPLPICFYDKFLALLERHPDLFRDMIYTQSGSYLFDVNPEQHRISDSPIDARVPDFDMNAAFVDAVAAYLVRLKPYGRVTWLGHRLEPQIRDKRIIMLGCDYPFALRPNQQEVFTRLDETVGKRATQAGIRYVSQIDMLQFDMAHDFMSCDVTYWTDTNHFSEAGEARFGDRVTLKKVLE